MPEIEIGKIGQTDRKKGEEKERKRDVYVCVGGWVCACVSV